jgi:hypothetical protein
MNGAMKLSGRAWYRMDSSPPMATLPLSPRCRSTGPPTASALSTASHVTRPTPVASPENVPISVLPLPEKKPRAQVA